MSQSVISDLCERARVSFPAWNMCIVSIKTQDSRWGCFLGRVVIYAGHFDPNCIAELDGLSDLAWYMYKMPYDLDRPEWQFREAFDTALLWYMGAFSDGVPRCFALMRCDNALVPDHCLIYIMYFFCLVADSSSWSEKESRGKKGDVDYTMSARPKLCNVCISALDHVIASCVLALFLSPWSRN